MPAQDPSLALRTTAPHSARMYDYYLGGKDNYPVDREAAEAVLSVLPNARIIARSTREFMHRATRWFAAQGIRQFLDIGTGIPTEPNLHQVAQREAPESRVVYVDHDPIVLAHADALLRSAPEGRTAYLHGDVYAPEHILGSPELERTLDLSQPVALSMNALFHFIPDEDDPVGIIRRMIKPLAPGSYLSLTHGTADFLDPEAAARARAVYQKGGIPAVTRNKTEFEALFAGLEPVEPGIVPAYRWHPDGPPRKDETDETTSIYGGVAIKR
ncbi:SAM-dependent methyltransferase [Streptomyces sp. NPDC046805]|uniref:SAM-dependent methyltransferase n=1 Tax=Streptomyces sp. NPDC046805 TaxID=3155134 RepID=UPI0033FE29B6